VNADAENKSATSLPFGSVGCRLSLTLSMHCVCWVAEALRNAKSEKKIQMLRSEIFRSRQIGTFSPHLPAKRFVDSAAVRFASVRVSSMGNAGFSFLRRDAFWRSSDSTRPSSCSAEPMLGRIPDVT